MSRYMMCGIAAALLVGAAGCQPMVYMSAGNTSPHMPPQVWSDWSDPLPLHETGKIAGRMWDGETDPTGHGRGATRSGPEQGPDRYKPITGRTAREGNYVLAIVELGIPGLQGEGFDAAPGIVCDPTGTGLR